MYPLSLDELTRVQPETAIYHPFGASISEPFSTLAKRLSDHIQPFVISAAMITVRQLSRSPTNVRHRQRGWRVREKN
jgi:hypothetical protein